MKTKTVWSDLAQILPGKTLVLEIDENDEFQKQEIFTKIETVNLFKDGEKIKSIIVSISRIRVYSMSGYNKEFDFIVFDCENNKIKIGTIFEIFEFDNALVF